MAFSLVSSQKYVNRVDFQHPTSSGTPRGTPDEFKARNQIPAGVLSQSLSGQFLKKNACISDKFLLLQSVEISELHWGCSEGAL